MPGWPIQQYATAWNWRGSWPYARSGSNLVSTSSYQLWIRSCLPSPLGIWDIVGAPPPSVDPCGEGTFNFADTIIWILGRTFIDFFVGSDSRELTNVAVVVHSLKWFIFSTLLGATFAFAKTLLTVAVILCDEHLAYLRRALG